MPITVKHSGNAAPTAWGAFGAGQGKRYAEDARSAMDRIFKSEEDQKQRNFQASEAHKERDFRADQAEKGFGRERQLLEDRSDLAGRESDLNWKRSQESFDKQTELQRRTRNEESGMRRDDFIFELSEKSRQEDNRLADLENEVMTSADYTDDEKHEFSLRLQEKRAGIQPTMRRPKPEQVWPNGMKTGDTFKRDGYLWSVGKDGSVTKEGEDRSIPSTKDIADVYQAGIIANKNPLTGAVDMEKAKQYVKDFHALQKEIQGTMGGQADAPAAAATPAGEAPPKTIESAVDNAVKLMNEKKPAPAAKTVVEKKNDVPVETITLKSGETVQARRLPNGQYEEVE